MFSLTNDYSPVVPLPQDLQGSQFLMDMIAELRSQREQRLEQLREQILRSCTTQPQIHTLRNCTTQPQIHTLRYGSVTIMLDQETENDNIDTIDTADIDTTEDNIDDNIDGTDDNLNDSLSSPVLQSTKTLQSATTKVAKPVATHNHDRGVRHRQKNRSTIRQKERDH